MTNNISFVEDYESANYYDALPGFDQKLFDYLYNDLGMNKNSIIADIGSGTGRLTYDFLNRGNTVYAIDPDANMRTICENKCREFKNFISINGTEENMNIDANSVDFVVASQVFHRFNPDKFKLECKRVLKGKFNVIIIWYRVDFTNPIYSKMLASVKKRYSAYKTRYTTDEIQGAYLEEEENNNDAQKFYDNRSKMATIECKANLTNEEFMKLGLSLSLYPITHEMNTVSKVLESKEFNLEDYKNDLVEIFNQYSKDDVITLPLKVQVHSYND